MHEVLYRDCNTSVVQLGHSLSGWQRDRCTVGGCARLPCCHCLRPGGALRRASFGAAAHCASNVCELLASIPSLDGDAVYCPDRALCWRVARGRRRQTVSAAPLPHAAALGASPAWAARTGLVALACSLVAAARSVTSLRHRAAQSRPWLVPACLPGLLRLLGGPRSAPAAPASAADPRAMSQRSFGAGAPPAPSPLAALPPELLQHCFSFLDEPSRQVPHGSWQATIRDGAPCHEPPAACRGPG